VTVDPEVINSTAYTFFSAFLLNGLTAKVEVMAMGVEAVGSLWGETNPLIMVTTDPFPQGRNVLASDDQITAFEDPSVGGLRWMFSWTDNPDGAIRVAGLTFGDIAVSLGPPDYQSSHHFDAWLYPQRVNYIANPSFERPDNVYWGTNVGFSRVPSDVGGFAGQFSGSDVVVESNVFPIDKNDGIWTTQLLVKGTGLLAVGFVFWNERYDATYVDWGPERWELTESGYLPIKVLRRCSEAVEGMLRLQVEGGGGITIDRVLMEPGPLLDWPYFDGDEQYGALDDFTWYGERGASYSLWYNNKRSIVSRAFTRPTHTGTVFTEENDSGLVYSWVPAGTVVDYHLDVLRPDDLKTPPLPKSGVLPDDTADPVFGVPGGHLNLLTASGELLFTSESEEVLVSEPGGL
jgi:hypothetical protein